MDGRSFSGYGSPLFLAWQLTNGCSAGCLACCEESGPNAAWQDELRRDEALGLVDQIIDLGIPYVAFGGGEPLGVPHCWEIFERLSRAGIAIKLETNGLHIDQEAAKHLQQLDVQCVQISLDGAIAQTHQLVRPGSDFTSAVAAIDELVTCGIAPQCVFVPNRLNIHEIVRTYELALRHGCGAFVTGPLMRLGRAAAVWDMLACDDLVWRSAVSDLRQSAAQIGGSTELYIYPWDILTELDRRLESPQAMMLVVPNGRVKLLNALPFSPANLRRESLTQAWQAYRTAWRAPQVKDFITRCRSNPMLLRHANEIWDIQEMR